MDDPVIFTSSVNPYGPAILRFPETADPSHLVSQFAPGFFKFCDRLQVPTFDSGRVTDVVTALFMAGFTYVQIKSGKSEAEIEYSNRVHRPAHIRPRENSYQ
ncbi:hypothetical protein ACWCYZ_39020 [Streptomyces virginiae]